MKKQFRLYAILTVLIVGMFAATSTMLLRQADATYVEGEIRQDTVWTLTDSPFIVIRDVVVKPGYTLTIEPGVEVRFGGDFSLVVNGTLNAIGTQEDMIKFTSNKDQPQLGDWRSIWFINKLQASTLASCIIQYAINGTTIKNGNVQIRNCEINNNKLSGVYIRGSNIGIIEDNSIQLNRDGICLEGDTSGITILNNRISANIDSGINFQSAWGKYISDIVVSGNTLSSNSRGINVTGSISATITHNSISYNDVGIWFVNSTSTVSPHFNDIYGNIDGVKVTSSDPINATYNYWGDATGPFHASLNPYGKGNPVQSDGYDLDFIEFLSAPNGYVNAQPTAWLLSDKILVQLNQPVTFIATNSSDDRRIDKYFFDFGDGSNTSWTTLSVFNHKYPSVGTYQASVRAMDDFGAISADAASVTISVQALTPIDVSISLSRSQMVSAGQVSVTVRATIDSSPVSSASIMLWPILGGTLTPQSGLTDSSGYFTATYAAPSVNEQTYIRIMARASKGGNADGSAYEYLEVVPPLTVEIASTSTLLKSEASVNGTVHVTYNALPVEGVTITLASDKGGSFTPQTGSTDVDGWFQFMYKGPQTLTPLNTTITATAAKAGYWDGSDQITLSIAPRTLTVSVDASPLTIDSQGSCAIIVHVASNGEPIGNTTVTMSSDLNGVFSNASGLTDANGDFRVTFTAPETGDTISGSVNASASKSGYVDGEGQSSITVNAAPGLGVGGLFGLSLTTLLLIIIPVVVVVIVVILIKKRIIVFTRGEES